MGAENVIAENVIADTTSRGVRLPGSFLRRRLRIRSGLRRRLHVPVWWSEVSGRRLAASACLVVLAVIVSVSAFIASGALDVRRIDVTGLSHLQRNDVLHAAHVHQNQLIVSVDSGSATRRLQALPWVAFAHVTTSWPHTVRISVLERKPVALVQTADGRWAEVGSAGIVLQVDAVPVDGLPVLLDVRPVAVAGGHLDTSVDDLVTVADQLPPSLSDQVTQIQEDQQRQVRLGLGAGTVVELGDLRQLADKLTAAAAVLSHAGPKTISVLDVRSPHLPMATPTMSQTSSVPDQAGLASTSMEAGKQVGGTAVQTTVHPQKITPTH